MAVSLSVIASQVNQELNTAVTYSATPTDPRLYTTGLADAILDADGKYVAAHLRNRNDPRRVAFTTSQSAVAHGGTLNTHLGPIDSIQFVVTATTWTGTRPGVPSTLTQIDFDNLNPRAKVLLPCRYKIEGDVLYHNRTGLLAGDASAVSVNATFNTYTKTSACQAPDEDQAGIVYETCALLFGIEGDDTQAAQLYAEMSEKELTRIAAVGSEA